MKHFFILVAICFFTIFLSIGSIQAQQFKWVTGGGTTYDFSSTGYDSWERVEYMCTDPNGNIYALSQVGNNPITADTFYRSSAYGSDQNLLLTSYNCNGQMRWAKLISSSAGESFPDGIIADSLGHIYVSGYLRNDLYIGYDTTIGVIDQASGLIQFDTNGHFNWVRYVGDNTLPSFYDVTFVGCTLALDGANNVHFFNYLKSGVHITPTVTSIGGTYDLAYNTAGTLLSQARLDLDSEWYLNGAVIDPATNKLYVSGQINQSIYGGFLTDTFYAAAFDASRNLIWMYFCGHGDDDGFDGIVMDQSKHLYFSGSAQPHYPGPTTFSFNGDSISAPFDDLAVVMKCDTNGNPEWFREFGCHTSVNGFSSITLLPNNKIAAAGGYEGSVTNGTVTISTPPGEMDNPYFVIYDSAGDLQTIQQIYGDAGGGANAITTDRVGNMYIGGYVGDSIWAGTPAIPAYHTVGGNTDFFVMKYGVDCSCTSMPIASFTDTGTRAIGVTYTGTSSGIDSIVWSFGDGTTAYGTTASHTYTAIDTYQLCVIVYTDCGHDSICNDIAVTCIAAPVASFTDTGTHKVGYVYTGSTTGIDSTVWHFGDGQTDTGMRPLHTYTVSGSYRVCVFAYNSCGMDSSCSTITVTVPRTGITSPNISNEVIQVYPNPAQDALNVVGITENTRYRLLDVTGICELHGVFEKGNNTIPMQQCVPGIYILEMTEVDGQRNMVRVVKE